RIESSLESGSASDQEVSVYNSSSPEAHSRSESRSDREESPLVELADRLRSDGASSQREASNLHVVEIDEDSREGDAVEQAEDEVDEEDNEEEGEQTKPRKKGSRRKGNIKNRLVDIRSRMTPERLEEMRALYGFRCKLRSPGPDDRPWLAPVGWVTLYEAWFSMCHLWVPLPRLLMEYADRRCIALSQILPAGIRYMVAALLFGSEVGVNVDWRVFLLCQDRNVNLDAYPEDYFENLQKLRSVGIQRWPDIHRRRVEAAINRITNASWRRENNLRERAIAMAPIQVNAPSLAARLKAKKSGSKDRGPSASRPARSDLVPAQEEIEVDPQLVAEDAVEAQSAEDQVEARQPDDEADEATQSEEAEAARLAEKKEVAEAKAKEKKKKTSGDGDDGGQIGAEAASKRPRVDPPGNDKAKEIDWSFSFEYRESNEPFVNNVDKCVELFGMIRGSTSEVPPGTDGAFKDMASFAFKFIASCNRARGQYMRWLRNGAARLKDAQAAGEKAVKERDAAIEERRVAEDNWQTMKRKAEQLDVGVKELTDKIEAMKQENLDLVNNLQIVNEAKIQVEKSIATEVVRAQRQADEKIEAETTRIWADAEAKYSGRIDRLRIWVAQQEAIEKVKLDLVQARGTLECLDLLKEQEMSEAELRAELESSKRDCEQKLENLSFTDLEEGDLPPPYPETPDGGTDRDDAEDEENHEGGNEPEE
ncbi:meiosis-specific protein ASY2-like, partial [Eutrema salsugineum]|uniref:meiosis-specific protein ASY2-like n=1 Tax=Eutrema salsugineum TaxID=72664 RepID=UPI000CED4623